LLVDTGSTYTWIKRERLVRLGIKSMGKRPFRTINNRIVVREVGEAAIECLNRRSMTVVVYAEEKDNEALGLHALEGLGLEVNPVTGKLRESEAILALTSTHHSSSPRTRVILAAQILVSAVQKPHAYQAASRALELSLPQPLRDFQDIFPELDE
jgi:predicted aspartyl protease